jgi:hypothetical protein
MGVGAGQAFRIALACLVVAAANLALLPDANLGAAEASNPGKNGRIAYVEFVPIGDLGRTYSEVYTSEADGSDASRLTFDAGLSSATPAPLRTRRNPRRAGVSTNGLAEGEHA